MDRHNPFRKNDALTDAARQIMDQNTDVTQLDEAGFPMTGAIIAGMHAARSISARQDKWHADNARAAYASKRRKMSQAEKDEEKAKRKDQSHANKAYKAFRKLEPQEKKDAQKIPVYKRGLFNRKIKIGDRHVPGKKARPDMRFEEVQIDEGVVNHRTYATLGLMHSSLTKHLPKVGEYTDYYEPTVGDKLYGKVVKHTPSEVHMKSPEGKLHKFKVTNVVSDILKEGGPAPNLRKRIDPDENTKFMLPLIRRIAAGLKRMKNDSRVKGMSPYKVARIVREEYDETWLLTISEDQFDTIVERTLTAAETSKKEEVVKAIKRDNPGMDKSKAYAIATATAKRVAEEEELEEGTSRLMKPPHRGLISPKGSKATGWSGVRKAGRRAAGAAVDIPVHAALGGFAATALGHPHAAPVASGVAAGMAGAKAGGAIAKHLSRAGKAFSRKKGQPFKTKKGWKIRSGTYKEEVQLDELTLPKNAKAAAKGLEKRAKATRAKAYDADSGVVRSQQRKKEAERRAKELESRGLNDKPGYAYYNAPRMSNLAGIGKIQTLSTKEQHKNQKFAARLADKDKAEYAARREKLAQKAAGTTSALDRWKERKNLKEWDSTVRKPTHDGRPIPPGGRTWNAGSKVPSVVAPNAYSKQKAAPPRRSPSSASGGSDGSD